MKIERFILTEVTPGQVGHSIGRLRREKLAERGGFEPPLRDPESRVLPLDDLSTIPFFQYRLTTFVIFRWCRARDLNPHGHKPTTPSR